MIVIRIPTNIKKPPFVEVVDIESEDGKLIKSPEETLDFIHLNKTAVLFRLAVRCGAILVDESKLDELDNFATKFGLAFQIYDDIMDAYSSGADSYFLGNIVLAEDEHDDRPEVVDGQQRLITLWLFLKAIHVLHPYNRLKRMIQVESYDNDSSTDFVSAIFSDVFEVKDQEQINSILTKTNEDFEKEYSEYLNKGEMLYYKSSAEQVMNNATAIYALLREYFSRLDDEKQKAFVDFFISKIYLLPIVLKDDDLDEARSNALLVFETINNRGMDLQDADIFKAKLYYMSLSVGKGDEFKEQWKNLISRCDDLELKIDDLFRYYYHIIRGKEGIVIAEKRLREFFQKDPKSPFKTGGYEIVLDDLQKTLDAIEVYYYKRAEPTRLGAWLQVLDAYTNQNPVYALIVFLYFHKDTTDDALIEFLKKVLRYCYYRGSTMSVKFEIYNIIYKYIKNFRLFCGCSCRFYSCTVKIFMAG